MVNCMICASSASHDQDINDMLDVKIQATTLQLVSLSRDKFSLGEIAGADNRFKCFAKRSLSP